MSCRLSLSRRSAPAGARGFALISAIFLLVILVALAAFLVNISTTQSISSAQDLQGSRAYHAARAGADWGLYQVLDPANATVAAMVAPYGTGAAAWPNMPACPPDTVLAIEGFAVTVRCPAAPLDYFEAGVNRRIRVYQLEATASSGAVGTTSYVERQVAVTVSKCRALDGVPPGFECP